MILTVAVAGALAAVAPSGTVAPGSNTMLVEAGRALRAGRFEQARLMIGRAIASGESEAKVNRLLADLAFATGDNKEALTRYEQLMEGSVENTDLIEHAGHAALRLGQKEKALALILQALATGNASWRAWNGRGVIADLQSDWVNADAAYQRAASAAPNSAEVVNNRGWSQLLRGDWEAAAIHFETAARLDPASTRIANNFALAREALASELPKRGPGEPTTSWAKRLNDAGVLAERAGNRKKAIAAFTQAIEASSSWYERAANNLTAVTAR